MVHPPLPRGPTAHCAARTGRHTHPALNSRQAVSTTLWAQSPLQLALCSLPCGRKPAFPALWVVEGCYQGIYAQGRRRASVPPENSSEPLPHSGWEAASVRTTELKTKENASERLGQQSSFSK